MTLRRCEHLCPRDGRLRRREKAGKLSWMRVTIRRFFLTSITALWKLLCLPLGLPESHREPWAEQVGAGSRPGHRAAWPRATAHFPVVVVLPPSVAVPLFGEPGYSHLLSPDLFGFVSASNCRVFPEAPLLIRQTSPSLSMDPVIFVKE